MGGERQGPTQTDHDGGAGFVPGAPDGTAITTGFRLRRLAAPAAVFLPAALLIALLGAWHYRHTAATIRQEETDELTAIARLKVQQIAAWRAERSGDARVAASGPAGQLARDWLAAPNPVRRERLLTAWAELGDVYGYRDVALVALDGAVALRLIDETGALEPHARALVDSAAAAGTAVLGDLALAADGRRLVLDWAAPVLDAAGAVAAVLLLRSDPADFLFPLIASWPVATRSSETVLVRREGDHVVFLNPLPGRPGAPLTIRMPLGRADLPAVQAILGHTGFFEGIDYRGVRVIAQLMPVPGSPWYVVTKLDVADIHRETRAHTLPILLLAAAGILLTAALVALLMHRRRSTLYRDLYNVERKLSRSRAIMAAGTDATFVIDSATGRFLEINDAACDRLGYTAAELLALGIADIDPGCRMDCWTERAARVREEGSLLVETSHRRSDGLLVPVEVSFRYVRHDAGAYLVASSRDITDRIQAAQALQDSELHFRTLADSGQALVWTSGPDMKCDYFNRPWLDFTGRTLEQELGDGWAEGVHPDDLERCLAVYTAAFGRRERFSMDYRLRRADGEYRWIQDDGTPRFGSRGEFLGYIGHCLDITDRKAAEEALHRSAREYRNLFEAANDPIIIFEPASERVLEVNSKACAVYGFARDEFVGMSLKDLTVDVARGERQIAEVLRDGSYTDFESRHRTKGRAVIDVVVSASVVEYAGQRAILSINRDVTERNRSVIERERLIAVIEQSPETVIITDAHGVIEYANPAFESTTGYSRSEAVGQRPSLMKSGVHDADFYRSLWETIAGGRNWQGRLVNRRKDGTLFTEDCTISPVRDPEGRIVNYVAVKQDITTQLELAEQLQQAQKLESLGRLAGGVAHDYNNMLGVILGFAELAMERVAPDDPLHADLTEIRAAAQRSAQITRQLLAFARKQTVAPVSLELTETVEGMLKLLRRLIGENIDLHWKPAGEPLHLRIDPSQVDQILANLVVNARDAIGGVGTVAIETGAVTIPDGGDTEHPDLRPGSFAMLTVSDDGCGMDAATLDRIFEPFFTTKGVGTGTGLGLATVYGIVKQNDGFIHVYSEPGLGATIRIYLPTDPAGAAEPAAAPRQLPAGAGETVLVVEDEAAIAAYASRALERLGYRVRVAHAPAAALELAAAGLECVDLLLTDVIMPGMHGRDLSGRLRKTFPDMATLFMSGYTADIISRRGVLDEGVQFLQKPFSVDDLAVKVRAVLDAKRAGATVAAGS